MTMIRKVMPAEISALGADEVEVVMSTGAVARDGHIFEPGGADLANYRRNPIVLWQHDPEHPVGRAEDIRVEGDKIKARIRFAPLGISAEADKVRGLVKSGIVSTTSVGMDPIEAEPLDPAKPRGGQRVKKWELLECSFCSVPVDTGAVVTARAETGADWKCGAARDLPIEDSDAWDGGAAEASIFEHAGGDDFDPAKARKGFLAYDAAKPKERGSYKLPIAHAVAGELKVPKGAIRAAASRLSQTDIPESVREEAGKVLDHYKEKAGMTTESDDKDRAIKAARLRMLVATPGKPKLRGLCEVAELAWCLGNLGFVQALSAWEAEAEKDGSLVPAMLGEALKVLGGALVAMTTEEVAELLADIPGEADDAGETVTRDLPEEERAYVAGAKTPRARAWRLGVALARAGRTLSTSNQQRLEDAADHGERAMKHHKAMAENHDAVGEQIAAMRDSHGAALEAHRAVGDALAAAKDKPETAADNVARALKKHEAVGEQLAGMGDARAALTDRHEDGVDAHRALGRALKACNRCVRAVLDGAAAEGDDGDPAKVQKSEGVVEEEGSRSLDWRQRQATLLQLDTL